MCSNDSSKGRGDALLRAGAGDALARIEDAFAEIDRERGAPERMRNLWWSARALRDGGDGSLGNGSVAKLSPNCKLLVVTTFEAIGELDGRVHVQLYDTASLQLANAFTLPCKRWVSRVDGSESTCIMHVTWLDDEHLIAGTFDGYLRILDLCGKLLRQGKVGEFVVTMNGNGGTLAVALFEFRAGPSRGSYARGIQFFAIEDLLAGNFEARAFVPPSTSGMGHTLRLDPNGELLWSLGDTLASPGVLSSAMVDRIELPSGRSRCVVRTSDSERHHALSSIEHNGELVVCTDQHAQLIDRDGDVLASIETGHPYSPSLAALGNRRYLMAARGMWVLDFEAQTLRLHDPSVLGRTTVVESLGDGTAVALGRCEGFVSLLRFAADTGEVLARSTRGAIRHIARNAFAFDERGHLHVGDQHGTLHRFDEALGTHTTVTAGTGPIRDVSTDPSRERTGIVGNSGRVHWARDEVVTPHLLPNGREAGPRDDFEGIEITPDDVPFLSVAFPGSRAWIDGSLHWRFWRNSEVFCWRRIVGPVGNDGIRTTKVGHFCMPNDPPNRSGLYGCALAGHPVVVRRDGSLWVMPPSVPPEARLFASGVRTLWPEGTRQVGRGYARPSGIHAVGPRHLAITNDKCLWSLTLDSELMTTIDVKSVRVKHTGAVRVDPRTGGLVSNHGSHLSFWGPDLQERHRMALLEDGRALWHVLHPREREHPGWLWCEGGYEPAHAALFESRDAQGRPIDDAAAHEAFVEGCFREATVRQALADFDAFVRELAGAQASPWLARRLLLLSENVGGER